MADEGMLGKVLESIHTLELSFSFRTSKVSGKY